MRARKGQHPSKESCVYFVGLSSKPSCGPLDPTTATGGIIEEIIRHLQTPHVERTNLVKYAPLDNAGRLRYPTHEEKLAGWNELKSEIAFTESPIVVTLGQEVSSTVRSQLGLRPLKPELPDDFAAGGYILQSSLGVLPIHHPSFVLVYRRKSLRTYVLNVARAISILLGESSGHGKKQSDILH